MKRKKTMFFILFFSPQKLENFEWILNAINFLFVAIKMYWVSVRARNFELENFLILYYNLRFLSVFFLLLLSLLVPFLSVRIFWTDTAAENFVIRRWGRGHVEVLVVPTNSFSFQEIILDMNVNVFSLKKEYWRALIRKLKSPREEGGCSENEENQFI